MNKNQTLEEFIKKLENTSNPALVEAVKAQNEEMVEFLLKEVKVDIDQFDKNGNTALAVATIKNYPKLVKLLLKYNPNLDTTLVKKAKIKFIQDSFAYARTKKYHEIAHLLLMRGATITFPFNFDLYTFDYSHKSYDTMN